MNSDHSYNGNLQLVINKKEKKAKIKAAKIPNDWRIVPPPGVLPFMNKISWTTPEQRFNSELMVIIAGVPGEKPQVTSDKLPDSPCKFPCIQLWMTRRIWHCIKSHLRPYSTYPFNYNHYWFHYFQMWSQQYFCTAYYSKINKAWIKFKKIPGICC